MKNTLLSIGLVLCTIIASATPFITRWDMSKAGSGANTISFNAVTTGSVSYTWETVPLSSNSGSGTLSNGTATITGLPTNAVIRLKIDSVNFKMFQMILSSDTTRLIDVEQWGSFAWISMSEAFLNCTHLNISATDIPNLSNVSDMYGIFGNCIILNGPTNINNWNTSHVIKMNSLFANATKFNQPIGNWNTSNVTDMGSMFSGASAFNQAIGNWNTSNVTDMGSMFYQAYAFNQPLNNWNTSHDSNMIAMFLYATSFNQPLNNWVLTNAVNMVYLFNGASSFNQTLENWNLQNVRYMSSMLDSSGMDCHNYSSTLIGWSKNSLTSHYIYFDAANIPYGTNAVVDRNNLITNKDWIISGDIASNIICYPTGIANTTPSNEFTLSPNPTQGTISISSAQAGTFVLYNMLGQVVYSTTILGNSTKESKTLPALPASIYNYILTTHNGEKLVGKLQMQ